VVGGRYSSLRFQSQGCLRAAFIEACSKQGPRSFVLNLGELVKWTAGVNIGFVPNVSNLRSRLLQLYLAEDTAGTGTYI